MIYKPLTDRQKEVYDTIKMFMDMYKYPPSFRDIAERLNITFKGASDHIKALERKGALTMQPKKARSIVLNKL